MDASAARYAGHPQALRLARAILSGDARRGRCNRSSPMVADETLPGVRARLAALFPGARVVRVEALGADAGAGGSTQKAAGYGRPLHLELELPDGRRRAVVFHLVNADDYGHDRRADRAAEQLGAFDSVGRIAEHAAALDVGFVEEDGGLRSIAGCGEPYLITEWLDGRRYAGDLRALAGGAPVTPRDLRRVDALARYLVELHRPLGSARPLYRRSVRDLIGSGEGIYGIVDGYPPDTPAAPPSRLRALEALCAHWRWTLRSREERLATIHGDFHPFNVLFGPDDRPRLLDASRGCAGEPADDVTAMAVNYVFFALGAPGAWSRLGPLWHRFIERYTGGRGNGDWLAVAPPYFAWRALVVSSPVFYPALAAADRDALLTLAERFLAAERLEPGWADEVFR